MDSKTAIVLGATGLVGSHLVKQLLDDARCERVLTIGRRRTGPEHPKLEQLVIDFDAPEEWREAVQGDVLFSALGTTIKRAGSQQAQHRVDYTYQLRVAEAASQSGVGTYVLVSAAGANAHSLLFYARMKGELERDVSGLGLGRVCILRPGLLEGHRSEPRMGERVAVATLRHLPAWAPLATVRPIPAAQVARAAIHVAFSEAMPQSTPSKARPSFLPGATLIPEIYEARALFRLGHSTNS